MIEKFMKKNIATAFFLTCIFTGFTSTPYAQEAVVVLSETVIHHNVIASKVLKRDLTIKESAMVNFAKNTVKKYWDSSYYDMYGLFSDNYRTILRQTQKIFNAEEFKSSMSSTERLWLKQTYQTAKVNNDNSIQIIVLSAWADDGYDGVMTFIFDMVRENNSWKIDQIKF